ncbi:MAG: RagB/SusD family nutrient uptake outer membrane protein [Muribaculaceae bacterium]|nr:RagB/SusD family nutrient uptake outer membrane protein [Muribaculaceae bacterium]
MKKTIKYVMLIALTAVMGACNDWLTDDTPGSNKIEDYFVSTATALEVVNASYMPLAWEYGTSTTFYSEWFIGDIVSDDALKGGQGISDMGNAYDMENFKTNPDNRLLLGFYNAQWQGIQRCNLAIEQVSGMEEGVDADFTPEMKARLIAEAKFMRSYYYFRLVRIFGGMPLIDYVVDSSNKFNFNRASQIETYEFIIKNLEEAVESLPLKSKYAKADMGRATRGTAQAMLLKANLYLAGFQAQQGIDATAAYREAKKWGEALMETNEYDLVGTYFDNFTMVGENGKESIFEIQYVEDPRSDYGEGEGFTRGTFTLILQRPRSGFNDSETGWGFDRPTQNLYDEFEPGDPRRDATIMWQTEGEIDETSLYMGNRYYNRKYAQTTDGPNGTWYHLTHHSRGPLNYRLIRYSDALLMYAEACCELGDLAPAINALNRVRNRVGMAPFPYTATIQGKTVHFTGSQADLRAAIRHERRVELAMEGHRWFDLCRWGIAKETMDAYIAGETEEARHEYGVFQKGKHELMPIPSEDRQLTEGKLDQNPGY